MEWKPVEGTSKDGGAGNAGGNEEVCSEIKYSRSSDAPPDRALSQQSSQEELLYMDCGRAVNDDTEAMVSRSFRRCGSWNEDIWKQNLARGILNMASLNLRKIPSSIFAYDKPITAVYIHDNRIESLPSGFFGKMPLLTWCDIQNNKIAAIPELDSQHDYLKVLILKGNNLKCLPYSLALARALETISVDGNPLLDPPNEVVSQGSLAIREYLEIKHVAREHPFNEAGSQDTESSYSSDSDAVHLSSDAIVDEEHRKKYAAMDLPLFGSYRDFELQKDSSPSSRRRRADLSDLYSKGMWRHTPYEAPSIVGMLAKNTKYSQDRREQLEKQNQDATLQKIRDRAMLQKWRLSAKRLQDQKASLPVGTASGPSTSPFVKHSIDGNNNTVHTLKDEYNTQFLKTVQSVREISENPGKSQSDARANLKKMVELRERLTKMTIKGKPQNLI